MLLKKDKLRKQVLFNCSLLSATINCSISLIVQIGPILLFPVIVVTLKVLCVSLHSIYVQQLNINV